MVLTAASWDKENTETGLNILPYKCANHNMDNLNEADRHSTGMPISNYQFFHNAYNLFLLFFL